MGGTMHIVMGGAMHIVMGGHMKVGLGISLWLPPASCEYAVAA